MSATFDATTTSEYEAATTAAARSALIVAALTGTISVKVFDGSDVEKGSGTMAAPWATSSGDTVTVGEVSSFTVGATGTPDSNWYIRFQNAGVTRWVRGSFGLSDSAQDFTWSLSTWTDGQTGTIGTATITTTGNEAPVFSVSPPTASLPSTGGTIQFTATDPEGATITYSLSARAGFSINTSTGLVTVTSAAAGSTGNITVTASDGVLSTTVTCNVTVAAVTSGATVIIPTTTSNYNAAALLPGDVIQIARGSGTRGPLVIRNILGTAANPIRIIGDPAGVVTIRRGGPSSSGFVFELRNCRYFVLDGYRASATKGCGIKVMYATPNLPTKDNPSAFVQFSGNTYTAGGGLEVSRDFTCRYIEVDGGYSTYASGSCIGIQINQSGYLAANFPGQYISNCIFEHNYVHDCHGEGFYIGPNAYDLRVPLRNITVRYNWAQGMGREGMQCKSWYSGTNAIYGNTVIGNGLSGDTSDCSGISAISSVCDIHDNWVEDSGHNGIQLYTDDYPPATDYSEFVCDVYNNVVINAGVLNVGNDEGIVANAASTPGMVDLIMHAYSNTVVNCRGNGIQIASNAGNGWVRNNIALANGTNIAINAGSTQTYNLTGTTVSTYLNPDYTLKAAQLATGTLGTDIARYDSEASATGTSAINQVLRVSGAADRGAYEYP